MVRRQEVWTNNVKFQTPLTNIRITTFVSNETEVKVIDPNKLGVIEAVGCRVREMCIRSASRDRRPADRNRPEVLTALWWTDSAPSICSALRDNEASTCGQ